MSNKNVSQPTECAARKGSCMITSNHLNAGVYLWFKTWLYKSIYDNPRRTFAHFCREKNNKKQHVHWHRVQEHHVHQYPCTLHILTACKPLAQISCLTPPDFPTRHMIQKNGFSILQRYRMLRLGRAAVEPSQLCLLARAYHMCPNETTPFQWEANSSATCARGRHCTSNRSIAPGTTMTG